LDGRVLVSGGWWWGEGNFDSAELYDPGLDQWTPVGSMATPRSGHRSVLLQDGRVLVVGVRGFAPAELFDPRSQTWRLTGNEPLAHDGWFSLNLVGATGRVLLCGGGEQPGVLNRCELYDPVSDRWAPTAPMRVPHDTFAFTSLQDGRVLVAGGITDYYFEKGYYYPILTDAAEIFTDSN
jgi:hypothetical protein